MLISEGVRQKDFHQWQVWILNGMARCPHPRPCELKIATQSSEDDEWKG